MDRELIPALRRSLAGGLLLTLAMSGPAMAQAICSAPHSSPVLAGGGSISTLPPGTGWAQASLVGQRSNRFFGPTGERQGFLADGRVHTGSVYLTGAVALIQGVDAWAQLPVHAFRYADDGGERSRTGIGDVRLALRVSPALVRVPAIPLAVRAGVKIPGSDFPVDATLIPLTEGQRDWEVSVESGRAFAPLPVHVVGWVGYRWREENDEIARKPGNERFAHLAIGGNLAATRWGLAADAMWGATPRHFGISVPSSRRRLLQLAPTLSRRTGTGDLEITAFVPVSGRNLPSGPSIALGYRVGWGLP
ncbi:MAG: hypothetical protein ABR543_05755 [Gemmatimonadaceae bacterium]